MSFANNTDQQCSFSIIDLPGTERRYAELVATGKCLHVALASPQIASVLLYVAADAPCRAPASESCNKEDSSTIRILARKDYRSRSGRPVWVSATLTSLNANVLHFTDGKTAKNLSTVETDNMPLVLAPFYGKAAAPSYDHKAFRVTSHADLELRRVPINASSIVTSSEDRVQGAMWAALAVAVIPSHVSDELTKVNTPKGGGEVDVFGTQVIMTAVKLIMSDAYKYLKGKFSGPNQEAQPNNTAGSDTSVRLLAGDGQPLTLPELEAKLNSTPFAEHLAKHRLQQLETAIKIFQMESTRLSSYERNQLLTTGSVDRSELDFRIEQLKQDLASAAQRIYDLLGEVAGDQIKIEISAKKK